MKYKYILPLLILATACSTTKNTFVSRNYHDLISHYNIFFNGNENYKKGIKRAESSHTDNFTKILPIFYFSDKAISQSVSSDMDVAIKKATKVITLHSITAKPELKKGNQSPKQKEFYNRKEYNKWIDDNYLLMGKAYTYQNQFTLAGETFKYIILNFPNSDVRYSALIWLARINTENGEFRDAEKILESLKQDEKMPAKYREDYYTTFANLYIRQKNFASAAEMLESAIKKNNQRHYKIRYTYILAQLYQESGQPEKALAAYRKVVKLNPPYEMTFNAKINMAGSFQAGSEGARGIRVLLKKMLKDEKNKDFQDQIYYALANISLKEGDKKEAMELLKLSISKSVSNSNQKGLSYLALADLYFEIPKYALAQAYYDSTMQNIQDSYENYDQLSKKTKSLTHLVENLLVYEMQDSVQMLARLPQADLYARIDNIISEVIAKEQEDLKKKSDEALDMQFGMVNQNQQNRDGNSTEGGWYFYNLNSKSFGQPDFRMKWGNRKLEDNWRRKNKNVMESFETAENNTSGESETEKKVTLLNTKTREYYLQEIPFTDSALAASNKKMADALFNMGVVYRNELEDYPNAITSFNEFIQKFPDHNLIFSAYYNLYEIYGLQKNAAQQENYKNIIISKFPDNPRSKILANPDYVKELEIELGKVGKYYEVTYEKFRNADYAGTIANSDYALSQFKGDQLIPKFMLLKALSIGHLSGKEQLKAELDVLIKAYPSNEESKYAAELVESIYKSSPEIKTADIAAAAEEIYTFNPSDKYYLLVAAVKAVDINQLNFNLVNFNLDNYDKLNLGIVKSELSDRNILVIQAFNDLEKAQRYLLSINNNRSQISGRNKLEDISIMLISPANYDKLLEEKSIEKYMLFYEKHFK